MPKTTVKRNGGKDMNFFDKLSSYDSEVYAAVKDELNRQRTNIELIASENIVSEAVLLAAGTVLTNKYAEGYPGRRYYGGCQYVDVVEKIAIERAKKLFGADHANVQPHSGANANLAVFFALLDPGDTVMGLSLAHGGHLSHGSPVNISGKYFNVISYGLNVESETIDYDEILSKALECKPKMIIAGASAYSRSIDFAAVRKICDDNGILLIADEVQCGNCRSGRYYASEYWKEAGAAPDIIATAKSLGGGVPISAITAREEIMDSVPVGTIGGTYCGNPLACASALKVMDIMLEEDYAGKAEEIGKKATIFFSGLKEKYEEVGDVRGLGSMLGVEFVKTKAEKEPNGELVSKVIQNALQMGLMLENAGTHGNVIRFLVPLCVTDEQLEKGFEIFETALVKAKSDK